MENTSLEDFMDASNTLGQLLQDESPVAPASVSFSSSRASSVDNTEDEDSDGFALSSYKERRREAHTNAEQKRRDSIKKGYEDLQALVPTCHQTDTIGSHKLSKAAILQRTIDYIQYLTEKKRKDEEELNNLQKEFMALKIMKANYDHMLKAQQASGQTSETTISEETKFLIFQEIMDKLFVSFDESLNTDSFAELSGSIFRWLEENCKPQSLREISLNVVQQMHSQLR